MIELVILSLVVFAITLTITKADIFKNSREFVKYRYDASFVGNQKPGLFHRWFYKMWTCPMCSGLWVSAIVCVFTVQTPYWMAVLAVYGLNWLWHCLENFLFFCGEALKEIMTDKHQNF